MYISFNDKNKMCKTEVSRDGETEAESSIKWHINRSAFIPSRQPSAVCTLVR